MSSNQIKTQPSLFSRWYAAPITFLLVIAIWAIGWLLIDYLIQNSNQQQTIEAARGLFGDKFGAINALFSGLAFAGIILTIILQGRELSLQRQEIEKQNQSIQKQRFEQTLFQLIGLLANTKEGLKIAGHEKKEAIRYFNNLLQLSGDEFAAFKALSRLETDELHALHQTNQLPPPIASRLEASEAASLESALEKPIGIVGLFLNQDTIYHRNLIDKAYAFAHQKSKDELSPYFRSLYHIFKLIDGSQSISEEEKVAYSKIVCAQLSNDELIAILYNSLARDNTASEKLEFGFPEMTKLVKRYNILKNINKREVVHPIHLKIIEEFKGE